MSKKRNRTVPRKIYRSALSNPANPEYVEKAPKDVQARHAQIILDLQSRIKELEAAYTARKSRRVNACVV